MYRLLLLLAGEKHLSIPHAREASLYRQDIAEHILKALSNTQTQLMITKPVHKAIEDALRQGASDHEAIANGDADVEPGAEPI